MTPPHISEARARAGRLGGRAKAIAYAGRQDDATEAARDAYREQFATGQHLCRLCGTSGTFDPDRLTDRQRTQATNHARSAHMERMRGERARKQKDAR